MFSSESQQSESKTSSEFKSTPIKLFGLIISSPKNKVSSIDLSGSSKPTCSNSSSIHLHHFSDEQKPSPNGKLMNPENGLCENPKTPSADKEVSTHESPMNEEQCDTSNNTEDKALKKPDKIIPCPRCNCMDTKFCYYNNYNVHQPRHFCKKCQRYWTAGGSMRNVLVGAGRRKNKPSSGKHYQQILVSEAQHNLQPHNLVINNGTVLNFHSDAPFCKSMGSNSNIAERKLNYFSNGVHEANDYRDDGLCNSNTMISNSNGNGVNNNGCSQNCQGYPLQPPCFASPWLPAFYPPGYHAPVSQSPTYWGSTFPGFWNTPWIFQNNSHSSQTLGKHSRNGDILNSSCNSEKQEEVMNENKLSQRGVWIPKTLKIDDPSEAAKSSIWATLGIKNEKNNCSKKVGLFTSFQSMVDDDQYVTHVTDRLSVLHANPAAMSRSLDFHETT